MGTQIFNFAPNFFPKTCFLAARLVFERKRFDKKQIFWQSKNSGKFHDATDSKFKANKEQISTTT